MVRTWNPAECRECGVDVLDGPHAQGCRWGCPLNENGSHHWLPVRSGVNSAGEPRNRLACRCGADKADLWVEQTVAEAPPVPPERLGMIERLLRGN